VASPLTIRFVASFGDVDDLPATVAELAIAGRSNVGKSSLINSLANRKGLAKTSKTPGATRMLNAFEVGTEGSHRWLVDLPGYGYARRSKAEQRRWADMIEGYLTGRDDLDHVVLLIDGEIGPTPLDIQTRDWLVHVGLEPIFVATKADKIRHSKSQKRRRELVEALGVTRSEVSWVSAVKGTGIPELRGLIGRQLGVL
jgi:GTP-binding protein